MIESQFAIKVYLIRVDLVKTSLRFKRMSENFQREIIIYKKSLFIEIKRVFELVDDFLNIMTDKDFIRKFVMMVNFCVASQFNWVSILVLEKY